ncbi:MAG: phospholipase D family protein [Minwuia sp.]|nr:phospholipase D family protein [Minwuia sp.]
MPPLHFEPGHRITPLIEADETFAAIEQAIETAEHEVLMAYWTLAPHLALVSGKRGNWEDLLARAAQRGVAFRILLADFDPVFTVQLHRDAWETYHRLRAIDSRDEVVAGTLQAVCSRNLATPNLPERLAGQIVARFELREIARLLNKEAEGDRDTARQIDQTIPGLWHHLKLNGSRFDKGPTRLIRPLPGSHHEKLCIVDRKTAFTGGLDIGERRYDTADHEDDTPWHDLACRVEGPVVDSLLRHFIERWNAEVGQFRTYIAELPQRPGIDVGLSGQLSELKPLESVSTGSGGIGEVATAFSPVRNGQSMESECADIATAVASTIGAAREFIYIESQYLREARVADWLIRSAERYPGIEIIVLLPIAPDRLSPDDEWSSATRHGHWLQWRNIERLRQRLGARFGVFTLLSRQPRTDDDAPEDTALGARSIYVHAKTIIVDDALAMIGSANLNGRSFSLDTETALVWREADAVRDFRERLWRHHLEEAMPPAFDPREASGLELWNRVAAENQRAEIQDRKGFIVEFAREWASRNARRSRLIRSRFV